MNHPCARLAAGAIALAAFMVSPFALAADYPGGNAPSASKVPAIPKAPARPKAASAVKAPAPPARPPVEKIQLNQGKRWATDEALRRGMSSVYDTTRKAAPELNAADPKPEAFAALGKHVEAEIGRIEKENKLPADANKQFRFIVADLTAGADLLKAATDRPSGLAGLAKVNRALRMYGLHFDHPGWRGRH